MTDISGKLFGVARRLVGAALLGCAVLPVYRTLASSRTGLAGAATVAQSEVQLDFVWSGLLLMLPIALLAGLFLSPATMDRIVTRASDSLARPRPVVFAALLALAAGLLAAAFAWFVLRGMPNHFDSIAQLLHARFWASGRLAGPLTDGGGFWAIQNALFTQHGWVSQYPPGHIAVLALFSVAGSAWLAGPVMVATTVFGATMLARAIMPQQPALARLAAILCAASPFFLLLGGTFMSHVTAAAAVTVGAALLARAWQGRSGWAVIAGFAFAWGVATRPLAALAMSTAIFIWLPHAVTGTPQLRQYARMAAHVAAGAAAPMLALLAYNQHFFGSMTRFGYQVALGPAMRLGLHQDPWGNAYGLPEAVGYTAADLLSLGVHLFESPLSAVLLIAAFLLLARRLTPAERLLSAWALAPVITNFFYWHHGSFMGPRMLHEAAPAWAMLTALAGAALIARIPRHAAFARVNFRSGAFAALVVAGSLGLLALTPQRALSYGGGFHGITRLATPNVEGPALVFVHDAWVARAGMTLAAHGYRLDKVETLLRQNSTCAVQQLADAVHAGARGRAQQLLAALDTVPRADRLPRRVQIAEGDFMRVQDGERLTPHCMLHARSDAGGILDLAPFVWRGDLPGAAPKGALFVRDLGPARNAVLIAQQPQRRPFVLTADGAGVRLYEYQEGMRRLWHP